MSAVIRGSGAVCVAGVGVPVVLRLDQLPRSARVEEHAVALGALADGGEAQRALAHLGPATRAGEGVSISPDGTPRCTPVHTARVTTARPPRPRLPRRPAVLAFAHRGGAYHPDIEGLENTLAAFRHAVALGYRYLETDVHVTRDGVLLAFHDTVLDRVTDRAGAIADVDVRRGAAGADRRPRAGADPGRPLRRVPRRPLQHRPQVRGRGRRRSPAFLDEREAWDRVLVGSFSARRMRAFRRRHRRPGGHVGAPAGGGGVRRRAPAPGSPPADPWPARAPCRCPHRRGRLVVVSPGLVRRAHAAGRHVHVWTIDDPAEMHALLDRGVDGLMTDRTDILRDVLAQPRTVGGRPS